MPLPAAALRGTLVLSSLIAAASYGLYQNNPQFRSFIDNAINKVSKAWEDLLASLSPEERQRQREAQRRDLAVALESWDSPTAADVKTEDNMTASTSARDGVADEAKARRRRLWEIAEKNAERLKQGQASQSSTAGPSQEQADPPRRRLKRDRDADMPSDPIVRDLADAAYLDPTLKDLMTEVASGHASPAQLEEFQTRISSLRYPDSGFCGANASAQSLGQLHQQPRTTASDPVIHLLVENARSDGDLRDLMQVVSSGCANDIQLEAFAARIHALDSRALERNGVDARLGGAPPAYESAEQPKQVAEGPQRSLAVPSAKYAKPTLEDLSTSGNLHLEHDAAERDVRPWITDPETAMPTAPDPEEESIVELEGSRFKSATMGELFPELTAPQNQNLESTYDTQSSTTVPDPDVSVPRATTPTSAGSDLFEPEADDEDDFSAILTPPSPSLQSVSEADTDEAMSHMSVSAGPSNGEVASGEASDADDVMSVSSDASWVTGVSGGSAWEGLDDPQKMRM